MAQADLRRVEKAALSVKEAREELRVAITLARAAGETLDDIARMAGVTRQRISQILQER
jgi:DNA-directed RNA polymerase sigma subunit (sigma70/sigma32)